jgi:signal transduction histidine kinase
MQSHDGEVSVKSELNKGTIVTLTFPDPKPNGAVAREPQPA